MPLPRQSSILGPIFFDRVLLFRFNRAVANVRNSEIASIRFRPHVDREFVTISDAEVIRTIQDRLGTSKTPKILYSYPPTSCLLEIELTDGTVEVFNISPTGMPATYVVELDAEGLFEQKHQLSYVMLSYNGFYRLLPDQPFSPYLRVTDQFAPSSPKPYFMYGRGADSETP